MRAMGVKVVMSMSSFGWRRGVVKKLLSVTITAWGLPVLAFMNCSASAPELPGILTGSNGTGDISSSFMILMNLRAILSAPPPFPAMMTSFTGFSGYHSAATGPAVVKLRASTRAT